MLTCTRRLQFCAGHRVMGHENKCAHLHGHNYVAFFTAQGDLDDVGRVIDFSVLKDRIGGWIDQSWDHGFILNEEDAAAIACMDRFLPHAVPSKPSVNTGECAGLVAAEPPLPTGRLQKLCLLPLNPTAENLAGHLLRSVCPTVLSGSGVKVVQVRLWETENCYADATL